MPKYIDSDTGFPSEVPCPGCGWPLYCCLYVSDDMKDDEAVEHSMQSNGASTCAHTFSLLTAEGLKCIECGHIAPRS